MCWPHAEDGRRLGVDELDRLLRDQTEHIGQIEG